MKFLKKLKKESTIIVLCVICLTISTMGFSYAVFFDIGTNTANQSFTTGNLLVEYGASSSSIVENNMSPVTDEEGLASEAKSLIYLQNNGNIDSSYSINIGYNHEAFNTYKASNPDAELVPVEFVKLALFEYNTETSQMNLVSNVMTMSDLIVDSAISGNQEETVYSMFNANIGKSSSGNNAKTYSIKVWLDEFASEYITDYSLFLELELSSEVTDALTNYTLNGTLSHEDGTDLSGAFINVQNGSSKVNVTETSTYTIPNVRNGNYKLNITKDNIDYDCAFSFVEEESSNLGTYNSSHTVVAGDTLQSIAKTYNTTVNMLKNYNNIIEVSSDVDLNGYSPLSIPKTYQLVGGTSKDIKVNIKLLNDGKTCEWTLG